MEYSPILGPVVALVAWTLVMLVWMAIARRRAFAAMGISWGTIPRGSRGVMSAFGSCTASCSRP